MVTISPSELAKENVVDTVKMLQEYDVLFIALKKRGPKRDGTKQYNKPFAVLVQWPLPSDPVEVINALRSAHSHTLKEGNRRDGPQLLE